MTQELWFYVLIYFFTCTIGGITGFGSTVMFFGVLAFFPEIQLLPLFLVMAIGGVVKTGTSIPLYREFIDWDYVKRVFIASIPFVFIGALLAPHLPDKTIKIILGVFTLLYVAWKASKHKTDINLSKPAFYIWAGVWGLLSGLIMAGGPALAGLTQTMGYTKERFVAHLQTLFFFSTIFKVMLYWNIPLSIKNPIFILLMTVCSVFGAVFGKFLLRFISKDQFEYAVYALLVLSGIRFII